MKNHIKKLILLSLFALVSNVVFAQDWIVTKDAKKIEAKVTEINTDNIRYKLFTNQDGPIYTMQKSEISSIIYQNGTIEVFEETKQKTQNLSKIEDSSVRTDFLKLTDNQQEEYLKGFDTELYEKFKRGQKLSKTGTNFVAFGLGFVVGGGLFMMFANSETAAFGTVVFVVGNLMIIPGIPIGAVGGGTKRSVQNEYREKYLSNTNSKGQFQLQLSGNGLGLAYVF